MCECSATPTTVQKYIFTNLEAGSLLISKKDYASFLRWPSIPSIPTNFSMVTNHTILSPKQLAKDITFLLRWMLKCLFVFYKKNELKNADASNFWRDLFSFQLTSRIPLGIQGIRTHIGRLSFISSALSEAAANSNIKVYILRKAYTFKM